MIKDPVANPRPLVHRNERNYIVDAATLRKTFDRYVKYIISRSADTISNSSDMGGARTSLPFAVLLSLRASVKSVNPRSPCEQLVASLFELLAAFIRKVMLL